jgi:hypothetical protein
LADEDAKGDEEELLEILLSLRRIVIKRALVARRRSQETFGDEIVALNDIDEAIRNNQVGDSDKEAAK